MESRTPHVVAHRTGDDAGQKRHDGVGRRTLLAGAAWSVPVIAAAVGTPLAAASTGARGRFVIETMQGGTWIDPEYYGASIQLRNDDTQAASLPVEPITSGVVVVTFASIDVGAVQPAIIANAGGSSPSSARCRRRTRPGRPETRSTTAMAPSPTPSSSLAP